MPKLLTVETSGAGFVDLTDAARLYVADIEAKSGLLNLFVQHTSASLVIQENADPDVRRDLLDFFDRIAPERDDYRHCSEGPDDMPAHIKATLTQTSLNVPVIDGALALGTWQAIYLIEHRRRAHRRTVALTFAPAGPF